MREAAAFRPARPDLGPGRWLRGLAGVREDVLDWVPEERPRYAGLGAIVLNTGLLAGFSMFAALGKVVAAPLLVHLLVCAFWAFVVITMDRWLIASTHGRSGRPKFWLFFPRLLLSALLGFVIAEPLLLWIFQPAIHKEVLDQRQLERAAYASTWNRCNPPSGEENNAPECAKFRLTVDNSPGALEGQLRDLTTQRTALKSQLDEAYKVLGQKEDLARAECSGAPGPGLSGRPGQGHNCLRDRQEADQYRADSRIDEREADLKQLDNSIVGLTAQVKTARETYAGAVAKKIDEQVAAKEQHEGPIGLLDEDAALGRLEDRSGFVHAGVWLLRMLLVALDCLPVLTKLLSGSTRYDVQLSGQVDYGARAHDRDLGFQERSENQHRRARVAQFDDADRAALSKREADQRAEIDALAAQLFHGGGRIPSARTPINGGGGEARHRA